MWPVAGILGLYLLLFVFMALMRMTAYGVMRLLMRMGIYEPLTKALNSAAVAIGKLTGLAVGTGVMILFGAVAIGAIVVAFYFVQSLGIPVAIVLGAIIIAIAIRRSR